MPWRTALRLEAGPQDQSSPAMKTASGPGASDAGHFPLRNDGCSTKAKAGLGVRVSGGEILKRAAAHVGH